MSIKRLLIFVIKVPSASSFHRLNCLTAALPNLPLKPTVGVLFAKILSTVWLGDPLNLYDYIVRLDGPWSWLISLVNAG